MEQKLQKNDATKVLNYLTRSETLRNAPKRSKTVQNGPKTAKKRPGNVPKASENGPEPVQNRLYQLVSNGLKNVFCAHPKYRSNKPRSKQQALRGFEK